MKSTAGFILALIGGILGIIGALFILVIGLVVLGYSTDSGATIVSYVMIIWGFWTLLMGVFVIVGGILMHRDQDSQVKKGGIMTLVAGILSLDLLAIIGGIIGIVQAGSTNSKKSK